MQIVPRSLVPDARLYEQLLYDFSDGNQVDGLPSVFSTAAGVGGQSTGSAKIGNKSHFDVNSEGKFCIGYQIRENLWPRMRFSWGN